MRTNYVRAKSICTESEYKTVLSAKVDVLAKSTPTELRKAAAQARKLSDKWLQQSRKQGNSTTGAATRSREKHELFKNVLTRIEGQLVNSAAKEAASVKKAAKKTPTSKTTPKKTAKKVAAKAAKKVAKKVGKKVGKKVANKATKKFAEKAVHVSSVKALPLAKQAKQKAITTGLRMQKSGLTSRVRGHVAAQGRRNQAARSARKR